MFGLFIVYFFWFRPEPPVVEENIQQDSTKVITKGEGTSNEPIAVISDSAQQEFIKQKFGFFSRFTVGNEKLIGVSTDKFEIEFSNKGGIVSSVMLPEYKSYDKVADLELVVKEKSKIDIYFDHLSKHISLSDFYFSGEKTESPDSTVVLYTLEHDEGILLTQRYTIYPGKYELKYEIISSGFEKLIDAKNLAFSWLFKANKIEPNVTDSRMKSTVRYRLSNGEIDYLTANDSKQEEKLESNISWVAFQQKYFTTSIFAETPFNSGYITTNVDEGDTTSMKYMSMTTEVPYTSISGEGAIFKMYFGPNKLEQLQAFANGFDENLSLGWFVLKWVNKWLIMPIWNFLETFIGSYAFLIVILVIIIRIILSPLTYKSHISMAKMRVMKPELDEIKEKNNGDMQKGQQAQMALYQKVGINPLSGCIPMLLQFPILVALFYYIPNAIELRQVSFLWAHDLSTYDSIWDFGFDIPFYGDHVSLFTLLMTGSTLLYTWSNSQMTTVQGPMKSLQYIMPVMFLFFFNSYAAGLTYYYFISNLVSFGQTYLFRTFIDEGKIRKTLDENKKNNANKKKSKFQLRLEEAMKASEQAKKKVKKRR